MDSKRQSMTPEKDNIIQIKRLSSDSDFFNNVFKRAEKIVSVIFYILSHIEDKKDNQRHIEIIKDRAFKTHEASLQTLELRLDQASQGLRQFQFTLVSLESTLRVAEAAGILPQNLNQLIFEQLIGVQRYLTHHYLNDEGLELSVDTVQLPESKMQKRGTPSTPRAEHKPSTQRRKAVAIPAGDISSDAYLVYSKLTDRAERIKTVLEAKPQATIKDIAEIITDVSEKTIQRELNSLIEKGQVSREGERRWSRYSVSK